MSQSTSVEVMFPHTLSTDVPLGMLRTW